MSQPPIIIIITHPHPGSASTAATVSKDERSFTSIDDAIAYLKSLKK